MPMTTIGSVDGSQLSGREYYVGRVPDQVLDLIDASTGNPKGLLTKLAYSVAERHAGKFPREVDPRVIAGFAVFLAYGMFGGYELELREYATWAVDRLAKQSSIPGTPDPNDLAQLVDRVMECSKDVIHPL